MSYTRGLGQEDHTAQDWATGIQSGGSALAQLIGAATGHPATSTTPYGSPAAIDPATGMPYAQGQAYPGIPYTPPETSYLPVIIGGLALVGVVGYFVTRKSRSTPNRRSRRTRRRSQKR